ncbi:MAG TPA: four helix bundle protein [Tepidisphaeraceae bacterium]|nr:four helix bundle protein [Tepidisphaeraceae bacterium]
MESQNPNQGSGSNSGQRDRIQSFEQLKVWQEAHSLVLRVFEITPRIPQEQQDGLAVIMEKAAIEIPKAIAEGFKRRGSRNKAHYYNVAQSSLEGLRYMFILGRDLKYDIQFDDIWTRADQVGRMLDGLIRSMTRTTQGGDGGGRGGRSGRRGTGRGTERRNRGNHEDAPEGEAPNSSHHDDEWDDE